MTIVTNPTPTPWEIDGDTGIIFGVTPADNEQQNICQLLHDYTDPDDAERGARDALLIKFAPDMEVMLKRLLGWAETAGGHAPWDDVEALLARVRGEVV